MLRAVLALVGVVGLPMLLAPGSSPCPACGRDEPPIPISLERGQASWHELELQPKTRYTLRVDTFSGESRFELFSLNPKAPLGDLKCSSDTKTQSCTFRAQAYGLLGVYIEPKTPVVDAVVELSQGK